MNWAIRVGQIETAHDMLSKVEAQGVFDRSSISEKNQVEWLLARARLALASGKYDETIVLIRQISSEDLYEKYWFAIDLVMAEVLIASGKAKEALGVIETNRWSVTSEDEPDDSAEKKLFYLWFRGVALEQLGNSAEAAENIEEAWRVSTAQFGEWHPLTAKIGYAYFLSALNSDSLRAFESSSLEMARKHLDTLIAAYPEEHPVISAASSIAKELEKKPENIDKKHLLKLRQKAPFL